ncbi:hypothetical protein [Magnetospirillum sp. SS-4]|uniref:hypothetical protein n=1 Tax=Magnetospirillum sp. SS-4 TaxID=2681465 RepID=UPI001381F5D8|nr:hypothetical protein [Magnetospirillum sp. SS-4]CAA7619042.1 conserved hypothetical protein [Magnetospirillum sp. SS-4]
MTNPTGTLSEAVAEWQSARRDMEIAKGVRRLLREGGAKAAGWCHPRDKRVILADPELTAFLRSVTKAGAWAEERDRVRSKRKRGHQPEGTEPLPLPAIIRCLPAWRSWGRMLIEAERAPPKASVPVAEAGRSGGNSSGGTLADRDGGPADEADGTLSAKRP